MSEESFDIDNQIRERNYEVRDRFSNCCNEKIEDDSDVCSKCKEHCEEWKNKQKPKRE